jgi:hypothetical protein
VTVLWIYVLEALGSNFGYRLFRLRIFYSFIQSLQPNSGHSIPITPWWLPSKYFTIHSPYIRYSDWLRAGQLRCLSSSPGSVKKFVFSKRSRPRLRSTQPSIQWVPGVMPGREAEHSPQDSPEVKKMWI